MAERSNIVAPCNIWLYSLKLMEKGMQLAPIIAGHIMKLKAMASSHECQVVPLGALCKTFSCRGRRRFSA